MGQARPLEPGPEPRAALGPVPGRIQAWTQARGRQPWARAQAPGPGPAHVSALLAIYVYAYSTLIYVISFCKTTNYSK